MAKLHKGFLNKLLVLTSPVQTIGYFNNVPLILFLVRVFEIRKVNMIHLTIFIALCIFNFAIAQNLVSSIKIFSFFLVVYLGTFLSSFKYQSNNTVIIFILILLIIERFLMTLGIKSPLSYDEYNPTIFIFAEKSYAALFLSFLFVLDILQEKKLRSILAYYFGCFFLINSDLGFGIFALFLIFFITPIFLLKLFIKLSIPITLIIYFLPIFIFSSEELKGLFLLTGSDNLLRYFVNLSAIDLGMSLNFSGTNLLNDLDLYRNSEFAQNLLYAPHLQDWKNMSGQAPIPNLILYYGPLGLIGGLILNGILNYNISRNYPPYVAICLIFFLMFNLWVQGFLFNPYLLTLLPYAFKNN